MEELTRKVSSKAESLEDVPTFRRRFPTTSAEMCSSITIACPILHNPRATLQWYVGSDRASRLQFGPCHILQSPDSNINVKYNTTRKCSSAIVPIMAGHLRPNRTGSDP
jgi:hypothetical protein